MTAASTSDPNHTNKERLASPLSVGILQPPAGQHEKLLQQEHVPLLLPGEGPREPLLRGGRHLGELRRIWAAGRRKRLIGPRSHGHVWTLRIKTRPPKEIHSCRQEVFIIIVASGRVCSNVHVANSRCRHVSGSVIYVAPSKKHVWILRQQA